MQALHLNRAVIFFLLIFIGLAVGFRSAPPFEAPDEIEHFRYMAWIAERGVPPPPTAQERGQFHQPPLYYLLGAPLLWGQTTDVTWVEDRINPFYPHEFASAGSDNRNKYLHTQATMDSPLTDSFYRVRWLSIVLGVGTLLLVHATLGLLKLDTWLHLLAFASVALHPQFIFIMSVINNDSLLIFLATAALYGVLYCQRHGMTTRQALFLGLVMGAILITKTSGFFFGLLFGVAFLMNRDWWRKLPYLVAGVIVMTSLWYGRNWLVYDDILLSRALQATWQSETIYSNNFAIALERAPYAYQTFWARFGSGAVPVTGGLYLIWDGLVVLSLAGLVWRVRQIRRESLKDVVVVALFGLVWILALYYLASIAWSGIQGRYVLPGMVTWGLVLAFGLTAFVPVRVRHWMVMGFIGLLMVMAFWSLRDFLLSYQKGVPSSPDVVLSYRYGDIAEVTGITPSTTYAEAGELITVTLHWRALSTPDRPLLTYVHGVALDGTPMRQFIGRDSYPGTGNYLTEDWRAGDEWTEHYLIRVAHSAPSQMVYQLLVGLYDAETGETLPLTQGEHAPFVGQVVLAGVREEDSPFVYDFGEQIGLSAADISLLDDGLRVCMAWVALSDGQRDYQLFVHLLDEADDIITQADTTPRPNYPTAFWRMGERIEGCVTIDVGEDNREQVYQVAMGLYNIQTGERLPVWVAGERLSHDRVLLGVSDSITDKE